MALPRITIFALVMLRFLPWPAPSSPPPPSSRARARRHLDGRTVDPCVDFFKYSCGGWIKRNPIPPDQSSWDTYSKMQDENRERLRGILESAAAPDAHRNSSVQKIGDYYASCTDEKSIEAKGADRSNRSLDQIARLDSKAEHRRSRRDPGR